MRCPIFVIGCARYSPGHVRLCNIRAALDYTLVHSGAGVVALCRFQGCYQLLNGRAVQLYLHGPSSWVSTVDTMP